MNRENVTSSMIDSIGYDPQTGILEVQFKNGGAIWEYYDIPEYVYQELISASSKGKYFLANIKKHYREGKIG